MKELDDLARPRLPPLLLAETAPLAHPRLMSLILMAKNQITRCLEDRVVLRKESLPVRDAFAETAIRGRLWRDDASREE